MAAALIGGSGADGAIYKRAWPIAIMLLLVLLAEAAALTVPV